MRPDRTSHVVEIVTSRAVEERPRACFLFLANAHNVTYWRADTTTMRSFHEPIAADVDDVMRILQRIGVARPPPALAT
jgi:hypothetical protein